MKGKLVLTYIGIFGAMVLLLSLMPEVRLTAWDPQFIVPCTALLYTLLVYLSCRLVGTGGHVRDVSVTAIFILLFLPGASKFLSLDETALMELCSQCIVPFFIAQHSRTSQSSFRRVHVLMLLMGIFCSYTHDGITIPLCAGFIWLAFLRRSEFFRMGCWPMVIGFVIGTTLSIWQALHDGRSTPPTNLHQTISQTTQALQIIWDTKITMIAVLLTAYLSASRQGRRIIVECFHQQTLLMCCAMFALCTLPFAPLGIDNAVTGVCFFGMYWVLILLKALFSRYMPYYS